jgi:xanthine dehydrogenase iron-sulfur cluster and FAD-binding subunit A
MPHPVQAAYVQERVQQFGYCMSGWIMTAAALRNENKKPSDEQIKEALTGNAGLQVGGRLRRADAMRERCMDRLRFATG